MYECFHPAWCNESLINSRRIEGSEVELMIQVEKIWEQAKSRRVKALQIESSEAVESVFFMILVEEA
jgi:hypothetical protein